MINEQNIISKNKKNQQTNYADGTWDNDEDATNVYKLFKAIPIASDQVAFYDDGVVRTEIRSTGWFLKKNEVFIFGFSRGAFSARCLAGMIAVCGLPLATFDDNLTEAAFQAYRNRDKTQPAAPGTENTRGCAKPEPMA